MASGFPVPSRAQRGDPRTPPSHSSFRSSAAGACTPTRFSLIETVAENLSVVTPTISVLRGGGLFHDGRLIADLRIRHRPINVPSSVVRRAGICDRPGAQFDSGRTIAACAGWPVHTCWTGRREAPRDRRRGRGQRRSVVSPPRTYRPRPHRIIRWGGRRRVGQ